ncbi:MAG: hypothetical protein AAF125_12535, partial [Chloroflexota bacterium]
RNVDLHWYVPLVVYTDGAEVLAHDLRTDELTTLFAAVEGERIAEINLHDRDTETTWLSIITSRSDIFALELAFEDGVHIVGELLRSSQIEPNVNLMFNDTDLSTWWLPDEPALMFSGQVISDDERVPNIYLFDTQQHDIRQITHLTQRALNAHLHPSRLSPDREWLAVSTFDGFMVQHMEDAALSYRWTFDDNRFSDVQRAYMGYWVAHPE